MRLPLKLSEIDREHLQELYDNAGVARDQLPYTAKYDGPTGALLWEMTSSSFFGDSRPASVAEAMQFLPARAGPLLTESNAADATNIVRYRIRPFRTDCATRTQKPGAVD